MRTGEERHPAALARQRRRPARRPAAGSASASAATRPPATRRGQLGRVHRPRGAGPAHRRAGVGGGADAAVEGRARAPRRSRPRPCRRGPTGSRRPGGRPPAAGSASASARAPGRCGRRRRSAAGRRRASPPGRAAPRAASPAAIAASASGAATVARPGRRRRPRSAPGREPYQPAARPPGSGGARSARASRSAAVRRASAATSGSRRPVTSVVSSRSTASFSARDLELGLAEPLGVVEADRGQRGRPRGDHVGRVEAAAEPGLDHGDLDPGRGEGDERGRGRRLELGDRSPSLEPRLDGRGRVARPARPRRRRRPGPISSPSIRVRSAQRQACGERQAPAAQPGAAEQRRRHRRHRGLAVGADDVDRPEAALRLPERGAERAHPLEAEAPADRLERGEVALGVGSAELLELGAVALELLALLLDDLGRAPWRRSPRCASLRSARADLRRAAPRAAPRSAPRPPPASSSSEARTRRPDRGDRARRPSPSNSKRARRATSGCGSVRRRRARGRTAPGGDAGEVAPAPQARGSARSPRSTSASASASNGASSASGNGATISSASRAGW